MRRFLLRLLHPVTQQRADRELSREIDSHLRLLQDEFERRGLCPDEARMAARRAYGGVERAKELHREARGFPWFDHLVKDLWYGVRTLCKSPGFSVIAIVTMALGIGATTAIFSVVDVTLLRPLPFPQPEQLVSIEDDLPGFGVQDAGMSVPEWHDLERSGIFEYVSPVGFGSVNLTGCSQPTRARFSAVATNYFSLLEAKAQLGRTFSSEDHTPGFNLEVVISDGLWRRAYGGDPRILDKNLRLDNDLYRVVGVMPPGFHVPGLTSEERDTEVWAGTGFGAAPAPAPLRKSRFLAPLIIARIRRGLTIATAQSRLAALVAALQKQYPEEYPAQSAWTMRLKPLKQTVIGNVGQALILLLGAVGLVLLIGCVNIANLQLARASKRGREMAVRQALGATRGRLMSQLLSESLLLSLAGGTLGVAILFCTKELLLRIVPESLPRLQDISILSAQNGHQAACALDWNVLLFALAISVFAGAIFGFAPALHTGRLDLTPMLKQKARGSTGTGEQARTRRVLVITEVALALVLTVAAGLLLRSFWGLSSVQPGFNPQKAMAVNVWLPIPNDPKTDVYGTPAQEAAFLHEVIRRAKRLPGVEEIAVGDRAAVPLGHGQNDLNRLPVIFEGHEIPANEAPRVDAIIVTPQYFRLMGIRLLGGRPFSEFDHDKAPAVAMVNEAFVHAYCANEDPLNKRLRVPSSGGGTTYNLTTVVGVLADTRTESLPEAAVPQLYLNLYQRRPKDLVIFLRGSLDVAVIPAQLRQQVQSVNPELPVFGAQTLEQVVSDSLSQRRFSMEMVGLFALTALVLAGLGIYGVIAYLVGERTNEIGIRLALGAETRNIVRMVLRQGLLLAAMGGAVGLVGAVIVSHLMAGLLYGVRPTDPLTFVGLAVLLMSVALLASYIPARRVIRIDPTVALRYE